MSKIGSNRNMEKDPENRLEIINVCEAKPGEELITVEKESRERSNASTRSELELNPIKASGADGEFSIHVHSEQQAQQTFGTKDPDLILQLAAQLELALPKTPVGRAVRLNSAFAALLAINPRNAVEGMLAVQMVAMHNLAIDSMKKAHRSDTHDISGAYINQAAKLSRAFTSQVEAFSRLRDNEQTNILINHVSINQGTEVKEIER